ncbi:MAG TPA: hypothetical protein VLA96_10785 [Terriglobales bacterium]|nr:hypothetical protein [Terriglobales bacterium]
MAAVVAFAGERPSLSAEEVLKRNIEASGGEQAIRQVRTLAIIRELKMGIRTGDINRPPSTGAVATFRKAPDKYLAVQRMEGHEYRRGFDGKDGWEQVDGGAPRVLKEDELRELKKDADLYGLLDRPKWYEKITYHEFDDSKEQPAHVLKFAPARGSTCYGYFDAKTFLEIKSSCAAPLGWSGGTLVTYSDYRNVDGLMIPYHVEGEANSRWAGAWETGSGYFKSQVQDVQINGDIKDDVFSRPQPQPDKKK